MSSDKGWGDGAGKGGGTGGTIRDAGGSFGKMEAAHEEQYFRKAEQEKITKLKEAFQKELKSHEVEIKIHKEAIARHKSRIDEIEDITKK